MFPDSRLQRDLMPPIQMQLSAADANLQYLFLNLDCRVSMKGNNPVDQVLTQWSNTATTDATWEDLEDLHTRFPDALAWGQANLQGKRIVRGPMLLHAPEIAAAHDGVQSGC